MGKDSNDSMRARYKIYYLVKELSKKLIVNRYVPDIRQYFELSGNIRNPANFKC